jgi:hypothetical protein
MVNASCAASKIMSDLVNNRRENMSEIGREVATSAKSRWHPLHHIQDHTVQQGDMNRDASEATPGSGSSAGNNSKRMSQRYFSSETERHLERSPVFHPTTDSHLLQDTDDKFNVEENIKTFITNMFKSRNKELNTLKKVEKIKIDLKRNNDRLHGLGDGLYDVMKTYSTTKRRKYG